MVMKTETSAEVMESGQSPVWNGKHKILPANITFDDLFPEDPNDPGVAGINWTVEKRPMQDTYGNPATKGGGIYRTSDNAFFGYTGNVYQTISNRQGFGLLEPLLADKQGQFVSSFSYDANVVGVLSLPDSGIEILKGDTHDMYLMIHVVHDGSRSVWAFPVDHRPRCSNAMPAIFRGRDKNLTIKVRHTGDVQFKLEEAARVLQRCTAEYQRLAEWQKMIAEVGTTPEQIREVINLVLPETEKNQNGKGKTQRDNKIAGILQAVNVEQHLLPQWTATAGGQNAYSLFNGFTRWVDHVSGARKSNRAAYALLGSGLDFKQEAVRSISQVFGVPHPTELELVTA